MRHGHGLVARVVSGRRVAVAALALAGVLLIAGSASLAVAPFHAQVPTQSQEQVLESGEVVIEDEAIPMASGSELAAAGMTGNTAVIQGTLVTSIVAAAAAIAVALSNRKRSFR